MDAIAFVALVMTLVAMLAIYHVTIKNPAINKQNSPPGPKPWPIIGNLALMGSLPHRSLHVLSKKYGEIMQIYFGSFPVVVASSPEMARQFLKVHDQNFASRPALAAGKYTNYDYNDMGFAPYGPYWVQARKIYLTHIFGPKRLESFEHIRIEERYSLISRLHMLSGSLVQIRDHLTRYTLTTISRIALGADYFSESSSESTIATIKELHEMVDEWFYLNGVFTAGDWIPWLEFLDLQGYVKRMKILSKKFNKFFDYVLENRIANAASENYTPLVDILLVLADDPNLEVKITRDGVKGLVQDLITGGTNTAAVTVEWAIAELLRKPHILKKAREEIDQVIGRERWVEEKDISQLPYLNAIIKETMRLHPAATLLTPHLAIEDCNVAGYDICKGTVVLVNAWSIGRDHKNWDSPDEFRPERYLGKDIDVKGHHFELLPFSSGRRRCPGYRLGLIFVQSSLANLMRGFNWTLPHNIRPEDVSMEESFGLTTQTRIPLQLVLEPRLPSHLYK